MLLIWNFYYITPLLYSFFLISPSLSLSLKSVIKVGIFVLFLYSSDRRIQVWNIYCLSITNTFIHVISFSPVLFDVEWQGFNATQNNFKINNVLQFELPHRYCIAIVANNNNNNNNNNNYSNSNNRNLKI